MRSSGCGFLEEQICHLGLETVAWAEQEGQEERRRRQERGISRGEERGVQIFKGLEGWKSVALQ